MIALFSILVFCALSSVDSLDNGLALTPPMGWMSWQRFRCITDCVNYPNDCISEKLIIDMADHLAADGYLDAGYEYIIIDDCWLATERDSKGRLQPDAERFPNGIEYISNYVHSKGLKFGIYEDIGTKTCAGYPGLDDSFELDANTFAEWGVDYIKIDGCYANMTGLEEKYAAFGKYLNQTGRPIVYSCSFPAYKGLDANYTAAVEFCNLWRNYGDIQDSWYDVVNIANWFSINQEYLNKFSGPGHWNDPDMLVIGGYGLSHDESIAQMTIWSVMAVPLLMSVDLRTIHSPCRDILLNPDAISINQDKLGIPGLLASKTGNMYVWIKPILPQVNDKYSYAFGIVNFENGGGPTAVKITLADFGLDNLHGYIIKNVFEPEALATVLPKNAHEVVVNPSGAVLLQITPVPAGK